MNNEYFVALYGWVFFNVVLLGFSKDKDDEKKKHFNIGVWWEYHWDNVVISFFAIPIMVWFSIDLWTLIVNVWFNKGYEYSKLSLLGAVPFIQFIYFIIKKLTR